MKNQNIALSIFLLTVSVFILSQLVINSVLSPLGIELQSLNKEKNFLVEENRSMEEQIAKTNSITVIKKLANEQLNISSSGDKTIIYIEDSSIIAERQ
jgi:cell division protein FtsB